MLAPDWSGDRCGCVPACGRRRLARPRFGDGFFNQRLFDARAHVAGDELDQVLRFIGSPAAEKIEKEP